MSLREQLRSGTPVSLDPALPVQSRRVEASWIQDAVDAQVPVMLEHAIIRGPLNLRYKSIDSEFRVNQCLFEATADFSYANFRAVADFSGSSFEQAPTFQGALFQIDLVLNGTVFTQGDVRWSRATIRQQILAERIDFRPDTNAYFDECVCGNSAVFIGATFGALANFGRMRISGDAKFSGAHFRQAADFENTKVDGDLRFAVDTDAGIPGAKFDGEATFNGMQVGQKATFHGVEFHGEASFLWIEVKGPTSFGTDKKGLNAVRFESTADFRESVLWRDADFEGVTFAGDLRLSSAHCGGTLILKSAELQGAAAFDGLRVDEELNFEGARFLSKAKQVVLEKARVKSLFSSEARFEGGASLEGMEVNGALAQFNDAQFMGLTSFATASISGTSEFLDARFFPGSRPLFDGVHFGGGCSFDRAIFEDSLRCRAVEFKAEASFQGTQFQQDADFSASHFSDMARFKSKAAESGRPAIPAAQFRGSACFEHARFDRDARFDDVLFRGLVSFRETSFRVVYFSGDGRIGNDLQLQDAMDLTGCTYDRIRADWKSLLAALHAFELLPGVSYNRQPYAQLEKTFRAVGRDRDADDVYLARRHVEGGRLSLRREPIAWSLNRFYWLLANYGVRPHRLIVYALVGMLLGALAFHLPGSVEAKKDPAPNPASQTCPVTPQQSLAFGDAMRLSIRYFLPVDIALLPNCSASNSFYGKLRFQDWAALLHLLGWLLVPVGIASLSGILRRAAP